MKYRVIPVTPFQQNCTLIWCDQTNKAALIDPGGDIEELLHWVKEEGVEVEKLLLTHGHIDHVSGADELRRQLNVPIIGPQQADHFWLEMLPGQCDMFGWPHVETFEPDQWLNEGDVVSVGNGQLEVIHCPGHTPGHVVFYQRDDQIAMVGDVLFRGSIGRTDFPQSNHADLINAINQKLLPLGDEVEFIPGHGPTSTFGEEKRSNPFL